MEGVPISENNYFVSFIDVMGFSKLIDDNRRFPQLRKVYDSLDRILNYLPDVHRTGGINRYYQIYQGSSNLPDYAEEILNNRYEIGAPPL